MLLSVSYDRKLTEVYKYRRKEIADVNCLIANVLIDILKRSNTGCRKLTVIKISVLKHE